MKYQDIVAELVNPSLPPGKLAEYKQLLAAHYAQLTELLTDIEISKPERWLKIRSQEGISSDKSADREWDMTEDGKSEIQIRNRLKAMDKLTSSISTRIRVAEGESRAQY